MPTVVSSLLLLTKIILVLSSLLLIFLLSSSWIKSDNSLEDSFEFHISSSKLSNDSTS